MFGDQLGRGLGAYAGDAGDVVDAVAHKREHVAQLRGFDAELLADMLRAKAAVVHRVVQIESRLDQLHQILVGGDDRHRPALRQRGFGVAGDDIVGLQPLGLDTRQRESARGIANHRELRDQILGRGRAVRLILIVQIVAEGLARLVEDDRHVRRPIGLVQFIGQFPQHRGIAVNGTDRLAMNVGERREAVIGAEDIPRAIDKIEMRHCGWIAQAFARTKPRFRVGYP